MNGDPVARGAFHTVCWVVAILCALAFGLGAKFLGLEGADFGAIGLGAGALGELVGG